MSVVITLIDDVGYSLCSQSVIEWNQNTGIVVAGLLSHHPLQGQSIQSQGQLLTGGGGDNERGTLYRATPDTWATTYIYTVSRVDSNKCLLSCLDSNLDQASTKLSSSILHLEWNRYCVPHHHTTLLSTHLLITNPLIRLVRAGPPSQASAIVCVQRDRTCSPSSSQGTQPPQVSTYWTLSSLSGSTGRRSGHPRRPIVWVRPSSGRGSGEPVLLPAVSGAAATYTGRITGYQRP